MSNEYDPEEDVGFHFHPTDEEIIKDYLIPKLRGEACEDVIATKDVYAKEPWLVVDHTNDPFFLEDVWYYFTPKKQVSEKKIGCGKNSKRRITGDNDDIDRGSWKQNYKVEIIEEETGNIIGTKQNLTYLTSNNMMLKRKKKKRGDGGACAIVSVPDRENSWIMNEYMLPDENKLPNESKFQQLVLCKIHKKKKPKNNNDDEASTSTCHESSSSEQLPINDHDSATVKESNGEQNALERSEDLGSENDNQVQINALIACLSSNSYPATESEQEAERRRNWAQEFANFFLALNRSSLPVEEDNELLLYTNSHAETEGILNAEDFR
ncbi:NAC domain-containing protein 6 [Cardamine amara subsp. amara]|uniref:NAC domain-containing protein 6 n=1 Tax=Cardamine amara subsp. amara TaxID=228776 RepID=A0ABD1AP27_CARAN